MMLFVPDALSSDFFVFIQLILLILSI